MQNCGSVNPNNAMEIKQRLRHSFVLMIMNTKMMHSEPNRCTWVETKSLLVTSLHARMH